MKEKVENFFKSKITKGSLAAILLALICYGLFSKMECKGSNKANCEMDSIRVPRDSSAFPFEMIMMPDSVADSIN